MADERKINVLVTDDENDFRKVMTFWLESKGYAVINATNGKEAVETAREKKPDIIFMDLKMPIMDGAEAVKQIRGFDKEVPIIIISAFVDRIKAQEVNSYGISGIFYKDKDFEEGLTLLETALRTHKKLKK